MKNQTINYRLKIYLLFFLLLLTFKLIGQEVIEKDGSYHYKHGHTENPLRSSRFMLDAGSKKHRSEKHLMPVENNKPDHGHPKSDEAWNIQRVHSGKFFTHMGDRSLALDADGNPHIAYGGKHLYYALYDGTEWHIDTVDDSWDVGYCTSLAFDSEGYPHISYYDRDPNGNLKYAYKNENGWHITTVDDDGTVGVYTSIALDANNHPNISYYDLTNGNLKYTRWDGSQWHIETIDSGGDVGEFNSLALDQGGVPHISYFDFTNGHLKYARLQAGQWQLQTIDNDEYVGLYTSIALDPGGHAHISYLDYLQGNLKYAYWDGSQWQIETIDSYRNVGLYTSLALDANDNPYISYYDASFGDLKYATKAATPTEYTLTFVVENAYGDPIADAVITLNGAEYPPGHYVFTDLEPGTYHYSVFRNCYQTFEGQVAITNAYEEVEIFLVNLPGDANNDGVVNVSDVIVITNYYMGQNPQPFCFINADVNADGIINVQDVIGTVNIFMGQPRGASVNTDQEKVFKQ